MERAGAGVDGNHGSQRRSASPLLPPLCTSMAVAAQMFHKLNAHLLQHVVNGLFLHILIGSNKEAGGRQSTHGEGLRGGMGGGEAGKRLGKVPGSMMACARKTGSHLVVRA